MKWTNEAEEAVSRVPFFIRKRVKKHVEEETARQGSSEVTIGHVHDCHKKYMGNMEDEVKGFQVETCFGPSGCPNRAVEDAGVAVRIEELLTSKKLKAFLKGKVQGPLKFHHEFRVSVSDCPNACSRPQIADIGLIGACRPEVSYEPCSCCGACVEVCREKAMRLRGADTGPVVDYSRCLGCGKCISLCPTGTLRVAEKGWRILVGGKMGRHPQLGKELPSIFTTDEALVIIERFLGFYFQNNIEGERLGEVIERAGIKPASLIPLHK